MRIYHHNKRYEVDAGIAEANCCCKSSVTITQYTLRKSIYRTPCTRSFEYIAFLQVSKWISKCGCATSSIIQITFVVSAFILFTFFTPIITSTRYEVLEDYKYKTIRFTCYCLPECSHWCSRMRLANLLLAYVHIMCIALMLLKFRSIISKDGL